MATLALAFAGQAIGSAVGGTIFGVSAATAGSYVGSFIGNYIDNLLLSPKQAPIEGPKLNEVNISNSTEGTVVPEGWGVFKCSGNIIWASKFTEHKTTSKVGGKGSSGGTTQTQYSYTANFAVAIGEGPIEDVFRIWADGKEIDKNDITYRVYKGTETQTADSLIEAIEGSAPAYRGTAYVVFEDFNISNYGNRIPQIEFEVFKPVEGGSTDILRNLVTAVDLLPGSGEFACDPDVVKVESSGTTSYVNRTTKLGDSDWTEAIGQLEKTLPNCKTVVLVSTWFADDLRADSCTIKPKVETDIRNTTPYTWQVDVYARNQVDAVSQINGSPAFGGTFNDLSLVRAILDLKSRGFKVILYPFIQCDIPEGNTLNNPYSDSALAVGQPKYPWRGRITVSPAPGYIETVDQTASAATQIASFFGTATASDFSSYTGPGYTSYTDCSAESDRVTWRSTSPAASIGDVFEIKLSDGTVYTIEIISILDDPDLGYVTWVVSQPVSWALQSVEARNVSSVALDGIQFTGASQWSYSRFILHHAFLAQKAGGVDYFSIGSEMRGLTTVRDDTNSFPFVDSLVSLAAEVRTVLPSAKIGYSADWSEYHSYQPSDGFGDLYFHLDKLWGDSNIDYVGIDNYLPISDWRDGTSHLDHQAGWDTIYNLDYLKSNIEGGEYYDWYYLDDSARAQQIRSPITDSAYNKPWVYKVKDIKNWWLNDHYNRIGGVEEATKTEWNAQSKPILFTEFGCPSVDKGTNQPNAFYDSKSSESTLPYFSQGNRDDLIQRQYIRAMIEYWSDSANNPISTVYGDYMINIADSAVWAYDTRPWPSFPVYSGLWSDAENYGKNHWLKVNLVYMPEFLDKLAEDLPLNVDTDFTQALGNFYGLYSPSERSFRSLVEPLSQIFSFSIVESGDKLKAVSERSGIQQAVITEDSVEAQESEDVSVTRLQETDLPKVVNLGYTDVLKDYTNTFAIQQRQVTEAESVININTNLVLDQSNAQRIVDEKLWSTWAKRDTYTFSLLPKYRWVEPGDVLTISTDGFSADVRVTEVNDRFALDITAESLDTTIFSGSTDSHGLGFTSGRISAVVAPTTLFLDLPIIDNDPDNWKPLVGSFSRPFVTVNIYKSSTTTNYSYINAVTLPCNLGYTSADFNAGPTDRWDRANSLTFNLYGDPISSVTEEEALAGANALALETSSGNWEIIFFKDVTYNGGNSYTVSNLIRGMFGTEDNIVQTAPSGSKLVILDESLVRLNFSFSDLGVPYYYRFGPATEDIGSENYKTTFLSLSGRGLKPYSVSHVKWSESGGDYTISWVRRTRYGGDSWDQTDVPLGENSEQYEVDILDTSGNVVRTIATNTPSIIYTSTQMASDGISIPFDVRIYQISDDVGRGIEKRVTINV